jgi:hypothetical protein
MQEMDLLVDGGSLFARAWAAGGDEPEAGIRIAISMTERLAAGEMTPGWIPTRMLICWDGKQKKDKGRGPKAIGYDDGAFRFSRQIKSMIGGENAYGIKAEADDIVATAAIRSEEKGNKVMVVSSDKDLTQLQGGGISYYSLHDKTVISSRWITSRWGIKRPIQVAIALAVIGDSSDNIKGIPGWGPKKVKHLFESVTPEMGFEDVLKSIEEQIPESLKPAFYESLELTLLNTEIEGVPEPGKLL